MKTKLKMNEGVTLVDVALRMIKLVLSSASFFVLNPDYLGEINDIP
jgi:hypothetical protein